MIHRDHFRDKLKFNQKCRQKAQAFISQTKNLQLVVLRQQHQPTHRLWETSFGFSVNKEPSEPARLSVTHWKLILQAPLGTEEATKKTFNSLLHHIRIIHKRRSKNNTSINPSSSSSSPPLELLKQRLCVSFILIADGNRLTIFPHRESHHKAASIFVM